MRVPTLVSICVVGLAWCWAGVGESQLIAGLSPYVLSLPFPFTPALLPTIALVKLRAAAAIASLVYRNRKKWFPPNTFGYESVGTGTESNSTAYGNSTEAINSSSESASLDSDPLDEADLSAQESNADYDDSPPEQSTENSDFDKHDESLSKAETRRKDSIKSKKGKSLKSQDESISKTNLYKNNNTSSKSIEQKKLSISKKITGLTKLLLTMKALKQAGSTYSSSIQDQRYPQDTESSASLVQPQYSPNLQQIQNQYLPNLQQFPTHYPPNLQQFQPGYSSSSQQYQPQYLQNSQINSQNYDYYGSKPLPYNVPRFQNEPTPMYNSYKSANGFNNAIENRPHFPFPLFFVKYRKPFTDYLKPSQYIQPEQRSFNQFVQDELSPETFERVSRSLYGGTHYSRTSSWQPIPRNSAEEPWKPITRKRRSADIPVTVVQQLDIDRALGALLHRDELGCSLRLVCELSTVHKRRLQEDEQIILEFVRIHVTSEQRKKNPSRAMKAFSFAAMVGTVGQLSRDTGVCSRVYDRCPFTGSHIMSLLRQSSL